MEISKFYTDNPLLDEIYYNCELMARGTVLKDEDLANNNETAESIKNADRYIMAVENKAKYYLFQYTEEDIREVIKDASNEDIASYVEDNELIPDIYRSQLLENAKQNIIDNYEELNNYYRSLNGLPNLYEDGVYLYTLDLTSIPADNMIDLSKTFVHELSASDIEILENLGIIDKIKAEYPNDKYLDFLGSNKISPYIARKAYKFAALKIPVPTSSEVYSRYCYFLERNRVYTLKALYNSAFKYNSPYYDKIMMVMIIIETIVDCIGELPEYYIRRDFFDERTIRFVLESNGIDYFEDIPLKYQKAMCKNINKLIKYSGSDKGIVDICSLFGFDNIEIFKYYIMRERKIGEDGRHIFPVDGKGKPVTDPSALYDLKFLKVPLNNVADDHAKDSTSILDYDSVTSGDKYWNGIYTSEEVRKKILEKEFNIELSKYISIDTIYELSDMSFDLPYLINMIMFCDISKEKLMLSVPDLSDTTKFNLVDLFIYLYALMYIYLGVDDKILKTETQVLSVKGFNFDIDLPELYNYLLKRGSSLEDLGVPKPEIPLNGEITSFSQLMTIFIKNKNISTILTNGMREANDKNEYDLYKKIYDSFFITELSWKYYNIPPNNPNYTYTDFLATKSSTLYTSIESFKLIGNVEIKRSKISTAINSVVNAIDSALNSSDILDNALSNLPTVSVDYIKVYLNKVINFFKSYKLTILDINTIYRFDDKLENLIYIIDNIDQFNCTFDKSSNMILIDKIVDLLVNYDFKDSLGYDDMISEITRIYSRLWEDKIDTTDVANILVFLEKEEYINPIIYGKADPDSKYSLKDIIAEIIHTYDMRDNFKILDTTSSITADMTHKDKVIIEDDIFITKTYN